MQGWYTGMGKFKFSDSDSVHTVFVLNIQIICFYQTALYWEPCHAFKMEPFAKIINGWKSLTISPKGSILDLWKYSEYAFAK